MNSNQEGRFRELVDQYDELLKDQETFAGAKKDAFKALSKKSLPVKGIKRLLAAAQKDPAKLAEQRDDDRSAAVLLGRTVYTEEFKDDGADPYSTDTKAFTAEKLQIISEAQYELDRIGEELKGIVETGADEGLPGKLIPTVVKIRRDPDTYRAQEGLLASCLAAVGV